MEEPARFRVGQFLIYVGFIVLVVFMTTDKLDMPDFRYFFAGIILIVSGAILFWRGRNPLPPPDRFRFLQGIRKKSTKKTKE